MRPVPKYIDDFVTRVGGRNKYGEPMFRVLWEPDRLELVGGAWVDEHGTKKIEMRRALKYDGKPRWVLEKWMPPEAYGSQETWEYVNALQLDNFLPFLDIQIIGPYPFRGEYELSFTLSGNLYLYTLEKLIRLNLMGKWAPTTAQQRKDLQYAEQERKRKAFRDKADAVYREKARAYYGPVSYAGQTNHTAYLDRLDQMVKKIEKAWSTEEVKQVSEKYKTGLKQVN